MSATFPWLGVASYSVAALAYGVVAALVIASHPRTRRAKVLIAAIAASSLWAAGLAVSEMGTRLSHPVLIGFDVAHLFMWTMCVLSWLNPPSAGKWLLGASAAAGLSQTEPS